MTVEPEMMRNSDHEILKANLDTVDIVEVPKMLEREAGDFLGEVFKSCNECDGTHIEIRFIKKVDGQSHSLDSQFYETLDELKSDWGRLVEAQTGGFNIFFGVNPRSGRGGKKKNIKHAVAFYADLDFAKIEGGKEEALRRLKQFHLPATAIIESGNGLHAYWLFNEPISIEDYKTHEAIHRALCKYLGSDHVQDISRVMRLPGTQNLKDPKSPRSCRVMSFDPDRRYEPSDFQKILDVESSIEQPMELGPIPKELSKRFYDLLNTNDKLRNTWDGNRPDLVDQTRSAYDMALANLLVKHNFSDEEIAAILRASPSGKQAEANSHYLGVTIQKARAGLSGNGSRSTPASSVEESLFTPPEHWRFLDAHDYKDWECKPISWILEPIIAKGHLVLIAGVSQARKTLLSLFLSRFFVQGGKLFEKFKVNPVNKVLYLALEDPDRRIKARLADANHAFSGVPQPDSLTFLLAPGFALNDPKMTAWLESLIEEKQYDVIFLDTYQKATPGLSSFDDEAQSRILHQLSNLTRRLGVTLIILDHLRKDIANKRFATPADIKGTGGKVQNADVVILIERSGDQLKFSSYSKDWDRDVRFLLEVSPQGSSEPKFKYVDDLTDLGTESQKKAWESKLKVLDAMSFMEWVSTGQLVKPTGMSAQTIRNHLKTLVEEGEVEHNGESNKKSKYRRIKDKS